MILDNSTVGGVINVSEMVMIVAAAGVLAVTVYGAAMARKARHACRESCELQWELHNVTEDRLMRLEAKVFLGLPAEEINKLRVNTSPPGQRIVPSRPAWRLGTGPRGGETGSHPRGRFHQGQ